MTYAERPWLARYAPGMAHDLRPEFDSALDMYAMSVERHPDAPLVHYFDRTISIGEFDRMADGLAAGLRAEGFQPGDRLAVYLQNVPQFLIAMVATWKAGGIMVSINPMNKAREVAHLLSDSGATALVTLESLYEETARGVVADAGTAVRTVITTNELDLLGGGAPPVLLAGARKQRAEGTLDLLELVALHSGEKLERPSLRPDDIAFLTYTSGTTGPPKGATNTHGNVVFTSTAYRDWISLTPDDVVLGVAPLFHITGLIAAVTVCFLVPMPVVLGYRFDARTVLDLVEQHHPTFTAAAITAFVALMDDPTAEGRDLSSLRKVHSGGAPIAPSLVERFERQVGTYIFNLYGLTETTSPSHAVPTHLRAPVDPTSGALSVGVPIFNTVVRVVDESGHDLPVGEVGELVTSGPQVVPGYWGKPEETAHAIPGGELHTGDVGFMDADGWFYVVDRMKDQINASGYKVWPREVEDVLYEHPAVREAAVIGVPDEYRGETVKAFVSLRPGATADPSELISFCKQRMAAYKYPRSVELVDELPKTVTGKILRRELRGTGGPAADRPTARTSPGET